MINLSVEGRDDVYTSYDGGGGSASHNLPMGPWQFACELCGDRGRGEIAVEMGASDPPALVFRMEKKVKELPVRKVFQDWAN